MYEYQLACCGYDHVPNMFHSFYGVDSFLTNGCFLTFQRKPKHKPCFEEEIPTTKLREGNYFDLNNMNTIISHPSTKMMLSFWMFWVSTCIHPFKIANTSRDWSNIDENIPILSGTFTRKSYSPSMYFSEHQRHWVVLTFLKLKNKTKKQWNLKGPPPERPIIKMFQSEMGYLFSDSKIKWKLTQRWIMFL